MRETVKLEHSFNQNEFDRQSSVSPGPHRSRHTGRVLSVSQTCLLRTWSGDNHPNSSKFIYIGGGVDGVWVQLFVGQGACDRVILVLRECICNTPAFSLVLPAFDDTSSLGSPPRQVVYPLD